MSSTSSPKKINIALQGGGSHGAFAWGVLDRLLEEPELEIHATVGTSAGAVNATLLTHGLITGGRAGGRATLRRFWEGVSQPSLPNLWPQFTIPKGSLEFSPLWQGFEALTRIASPYQFNPLNYSPLRKLMTECVDFEVIRKATQKLFSVRGECADQSAENFRECRNQRRVGPSLDLPAVSVSSGRNRRRSLLGWWLSRQSANFPADL
nr:patatin-like phospholipase family protein [Elstera litoralis]